jgi:glycosyltransferase involved in cell wall biosynthesis
VKIAIDTQTTLGQRSGFGFYVKNLVEALQKIDKNNKYILIAPKQKQDFYTLERFTWDQFKFPKIAKNKKVDILHQPCFSVPIFYKGKKVVTVHDIIPLIFPGNLPLVSRLFYSRWMTYSYRYADMIIADSICTKNDIVKHLGIAPEKIKVIYLAVSSDFKPESSRTKTEEIEKKYNTTDKYFIHIGTLEPRKNLMFLVRSYSLAVKSGVKENLVIAGKKGWYFEGLFDLVKKLGLEKRVIFTGYVEDKDTPTLYSGATALIFPSIYEGFGFPPLEAMACGTPVISSNTSSLPEVVGDAGILIPPKNEKEWANMMIEVSQNNKLAEKLKIKGLQQAKKFSWEQTAKKTIEIYDSISK